MAKNKKQRLDGIVYSTDTNYSYQETEEFEGESIPANQQNLRVSLDRKQRGGKSVTLITGFKGKKEDLENLGKFIKQKCGVGGAIKAGQIMIQGDFRTRVVELLQNEQYKVKLSGG